jgi:hypothetical protein
MRKLKYLFLIITTYLTISGSLTAQCGVNVSVSYLGNGGISVVSQVVVDSSWIHTVDINFGDGSSISNIDSTTHHYNTNGTYIIATTLHAYSQLDSTIDCYSWVYDTVTISVPSTCNLTAYLTTSLYVNRVTIFTSANNYFTSNNFLHDGVVFSVSQNDTSYFYEQTPGLHTLCYYVEDSSNLFCYDSVCVIYNSISPTCNASFNIWEDSTNVGVWYGNESSTSNSGSMMYQWDFGDGTLDYNHYPSHTYSAPGNYVICLTIIDYWTNCWNSTCDSSAAFRITQTASTNAIMESLTILDPQVGFEDKLTFLNGINIFPSPMQENTTVEFNSTQNTTAKVEIVNILGTVVSSENVSITKGNNELKLNTSALETGIYILNIIAKNGKVARVKALK